MDVDEYRKRGKEMVDYIADYLQNIRKRRVFPDVSPGYMRALIPESAPERGEPWTDIFRDVERVIMPGVTHWQSPHMHAYFPALNSFPSLLGDMLADAIGCLGFTWASSPACTELETITMDWLGKMVGLPTDFLHSNQQTLGGGVIQTTASDCTFVSLLAARAEIIRKVKASSGFDDAEINARLICYCSDQAHSSVEKASLIGLVKLRFLESDDSLSLRGETLREAIDRDREEGLIPFYLCATIGTTGACAYDNLRELGPICEEEGIWMHIDAAYAGSAFICPEFRKYMAGVEYAQSFAFNPSKWLMVHFDCSGMWLKNSGALHRTFNVDPLYLKHENSGAAIDYMHWQIALSRRFRALKLWFVIRSFGVDGLQRHIRKGVDLAKMFERFVRKDPRFEIPAERTLGLVVFRLKGGNELTELLLKRLNKLGRVHMVPAAIKGRYIIRFTVTSQYTTPDDIERDWTLIQTTADQVLEDLAKEDEAQTTAAEGEEEPGEITQLEEEGSTLAPLIEDVEQQRETAVTKAASPTTLQRLPSMKKKKDYGISLVLSNVPMSPKVINGSFAALFENSDVTAAFARHFRGGDISSGFSRRLSPRGRRGKMLREHGNYRQLSLDHSFFGSRTGTFSTSAARYKQSSLDSKIDDILEVSSQCSDTDLPKVNGRSCASESTDTLDLDRDLEALKVEEDGGSDWRTKTQGSLQQGEVTSSLGREVRGVEEDNQGMELGKVRGKMASCIGGRASSVCKHCGMAVSDE